MATKKDFEDRLKYLREEEQIRNRLEGKKIPSPFDNRDLQEIIKSAGGIEEAMKLIERQTAAVKAEIRNLKDGVTEFKDLTRAITSEFGRMEKATTKVGRSYRKINGFADQLSEISLDLGNASVKDLKILKEKTDLEFKRLKSFNRQLQAQKEQVQAEIKSGKLKGKALEDKLDELKTIDNAIDASNDELGLIEDKDKAFKNVGKRLKEINRIAGIGGGLLAGLGAALGNVGFSGLATHFEKGSEAARDFAVKSHEAFDRMGLKGVSRGLAGIFASIGSLAAGIGKTLGSAISSVFSAQGILIGGLTAAIKLFTHLDHSVSEVGKSLGLSSESARKLTFDLKDQALASDELFINMDRLVGAQLEISRSLGSNVQLTGQQLEDQTYLAEFAGLQGDQLVRAYKTSLLMGQSQEAIFDTVVKQNDSIFTATQLFGEAMNTTGQIAANLGNNPVLIAKAVGEAKRLGINLDTARSMADSTLDFESSIAAEMEAQVLTGKALNLNRARQLAFQGDNVGAAKEMLKQVGSLNEFQNMNVIAQKSLAQAMGLSVDELADQLTEAEANAKIEARINQLRAEGKSLAEAELKARDENRTVGEAINDIVTKLKDLFGGLVKGPLNAFRNVLMNSDEILGAIKSGFAAAGGFAEKMFAPVAGSEKSLAMAMPTVESIKQGFTKVAEFAGMAVNFIASIPDKLKALKENPIFQFISSLFGEGGGTKLAIAGGVGVLGKMLLGRGSPTNPMHVILSKGGALIDGIKNLFKKKGPANLAKMAGKPGAGAVMKATGKKVYGAAATSAVKAGTASVAKSGGKSIAKQAGKLGAKALGKSLLKKIPGVGLLAGVGFGLQRALSGDFAGAALELASGAASTIPGIGTGLSIAADAALVARDLNRAKKLNELQETVDAPPATQEIPVTDFVIKPLNQDTITMAGGTKLGGNVEKLLEILIQEVRNGGDVIMDGNKVGTTLQMASYKL